MTVDFGPLQEVWGVRGGCTYSIEMAHRGLHKHRVIKSSDRNVVNAKVQAQVADWNEQWAKKQSIENRTRTREQHKEQAASMTADAQQVIQSLRGLLAATLTRNDAIDWSRLKDTEGFSIPAPSRPTLPAAPKPNKAPGPPDRSSFVLQPGTLDRLFASRRSRKEAEADAAFRAAMDSWKDRKSQIDAANQAAMTAHSVRIAEIKREHAKTLASWEAERDEHYSKQAAANKAIDEFRERYFSGDTGALLEYCDMVLSNSSYPECLPHEFDLDFNPENGILLVNYKLPAPDDLPTVVEVRYVQATDTLSEKCLTASQATRLYDEVLYQISLRTVHELFEADQTSAIKSIVFNGCVTSTDKGTGQTVTACVLSVQAGRAAFDQIDLGKVDPKACFRQLRGVGSSRLHSLTPIPPILEMSREDPRFVQSYGVVEHLHEGYNLAGMDWEDFEHLIREIFEKEFSSAGGEVKVTQASRDGGVDAIAFDPDPIRGGKIVIQAKRYTNTVGVAAVRDLYGTVLNEGATKGILVATSDYGPDAYEFAKGKPLTLLSGSNLLHLLQRHGVSAHIDLAEARRQQSAQRAGSDL